MEKTGGERGENKREARLRSNSGSRKRHRKKKKEKRLDSKEIY